jgi:hypothetical protein
MKNSFWFMIQTIVQLNQDGPKPVSFDNLA